jgi:hypothetical protein
MDLSIFLITKSGHVDQIKIKSNPSIQHVRELPCFSGFPFAAPAPQHPPTQTPRAPRGFVGRDSRLATRRQTSRGADRDRAAMSTSRRRTLLKVIVLGDSGSANCSLPPPPPPPRTQLPVAPPDPSACGFPDRCCDFQEDWRFDLDAIAATSVFHSVLLV